MNQIPMLLFTLAFAATVLWAVTSPSDPPLGRR